MVSKLLIPVKSESQMHDALELVCQTFVPVSYLEIGVQEGKSVQLVVKSAPSLCFMTLIDTWGTEHGGTGRGGHNHISLMLEQEKYRGYTRFLDGSSHEILPTMRGELYDLILVDGDHSEFGATSDLADSWHLLKPGGILVYDDLTCPPYPWLLPVWYKFMASTSDAEQLACVTDRPWGVAVARKRMLNAESLGYAKNVKG
jgi:hypothetical protein